MNYVSTRGEAPALGFADVLLAGLARDGGLYVPSIWPTLGAATIAGFAGRPYAEVATEVISRFTGGDIARADLAAMCEAAYAGFRHPAIAPLVQIGPGDFVLELFHGPTLAFKDVAMQLLARLMDFALRRRGGRATIVGATSGDTGGAAIEAFRGRDNVDVVILFPKGRVSPVQQRQMTTATEGNVHAVAVEGSFDDCQAAVKAMFAHAAFRDRVALAGVNSINWARIVAQVVYYFTSAVALGSPHRQVSFTVPTGNFGDVFAGYVARRMGLPIGQLVVATNANDILARAFAGGRYETRGVAATQSPSMDIQVSSNFERLLFEAVGRDAATVRRLMAGLAQSGAFTVPPEALAFMAAAGFSAASTDEAATAATIRDIFAETGMLVDPHTAVALSVSRRQPRNAAPMVTLATAHPAKFPDAVSAAGGVAPALPAGVADLIGRPERFTVLPNDLAAIEAFILARARAVTAEA